MTSKGFRLVSTSDAMDMLVSLNNSGGWDDHVLKCLQLIQRDHVFYDIGANLGYIAVGVACLGSAGTRLFAFEPLEGLAGAIARSAALNGLDRLTIYRAALDRETGRQNFFVPAHTIHASFVSRARATRRIDVATFALDELIADGALPAPHLVKIDVEGAEMRVIDGAAHTLATHRPAIVYECDENSRRFGHTPKTIIGKLRELGYCRFARINPATGDEQDASGAGDDDYGDFVALAK